LSKCRKILRIHRFKSDWDEICLDVILQVNPHQLTVYVEDGGHNLISCRKVLPSGECTHTASARRICSSVRQFLIYSTSTFTLVMYIPLVTAKVHLHIRSIEVHLYSIESCRIAMVVTYAQSSLLRYVVVFQLDDG